jgi:hypothetical protein
VIFIDSNIPMYLVGAPHRNKVDAQRWLERCAADGTRLVTDAEVFQEILHRYVAIKRRDAISPAFSLLEDAVDEIIPIDLQDVRRARELVLSTVSSTARDALHVAAMERRGIEIIMTFDRDFDAFPGIRRFT